jgi:hypothetical protein
MLNSCNLPDSLQIPIVVVISKMLVRNSKKLADMYKFFIFSIVLIGPCILCISHVV